MVRCVLAGPARGASRSLTFGAAKAATAFDEEPAGSGSSAAEASRRPISAFDLRRAGGQGGGAA